MLRNLRKKAVSYVPDKLYYQLVNIRVHRYHLNFKEPKRFNEKIHWLMLYDRRDEYTKLADKYSVRAFVAERIGEQYLNTLYGVYTSADEIDFDNLPAKFVLKATHGCGYNIICHDKQRLDWPASKRALQKWFETSPYTFTREWVYKNIDPRIVCEAYLESSSHLGLVDYKFFCFYGEPKLIQVDFDRFTKHTRNIYDPEWQLQPFCFKYINSQKRTSRPQNLEEMLHVAHKLSTGIPFCRVDLYSLENRIVFGEITFYPEGGTGKFFPDLYDFYVGDLLELPLNARI